MRFKPKNSTLHTFWWVFPPTGVLMWSAFGFLNIPPVKRLAMWYDGLLELRSMMERQYQITKQGNYAVRDIHGAYQRAKNPYHPDYRPLREMAYNVVYWRRVKDLGIEKATQKARKAARSVCTDLDLPQVKEPRLAMVAWEEEKGELVLHVFGKKSLDDGTSALKINVGLRAYNDTEPFDYFILGSHGAIGPFKTQG